jgi:hypothetical protein
MRFQPFEFAGTPFLERLLAESGNAKGIHLETRSPHSQPRWRRQTICGLIQCSGIKAVRVGCDEIALAVAAI